MTRTAGHVFLVSVCFAGFLCARPCLAGSSCQTGPGLFDYGTHRNNLEAEHLAMFYANTLRAPDAAYERILRDLGLIRRAYPFLESKPIELLYPLNQLIVQLDPNLPTTSYEALNVFYQVVNVEQVDPNFYTLTFCDNLNIPLLAQEYEALSEVIMAWPNAAFGSPVNYANVTANGDTYGYEIENGAGDCPSGCTCFRTWHFEVALDGTVTLVDYAETPDCDDFLIEVVPCCQQYVACSVMTVQDCLDASGIPLAIGDDCTMCAPPIPAVSAWGMTIAALLLCVAGSVLTRHRAVPSRHGAPSTPRAP